MIAIGLVPDLTTEVSNRAALGAGAKVTRVFSYRLTDREIHEIDEIHPDIILLAGGTDGGNSEVILHNAKCLARANIHCPVVVAGNKETVGDVELLLNEGDYQVYIAENVMPEIGKLAVESAREKIREVFLKHIVQAKGLDKAKTLVDEIIMPTPMAVLKVATLLAEGSNRQKGMGELLVVDVGGATTDIHSAAKGIPVNPSITLKGLPEPFAKRTVEGDLGIRSNAHTILQLAGSMPDIDENFSKYDRKRAEERVRYLSTNTEILSKEERAKQFDWDLTRAAVKIAADRHVGRLETVYTVSGPVYIQIGKDLTRVQSVIGTGGIFSHGSKPEYILDGARRFAGQELFLKPEKPEYFIDSRYILFAAGLLGQLDEDLALSVLKRYLQRVG